MLSEPVTGSDESSLYAMPGATSHQSGSSAQRVSRAGPAPGSAAMPMRRASCSHRGAGGRNTSVGQQSNEFTIGRNASSSPRHSEHAPTWASKADDSSAGSERSTYSATESI